MTLAAALTSCTTAPSPSTPLPTDAAGNASPVGSSSFVLEGTAPAAPVLTLAAAVEGGATRAEASSASGVLRISGLSGATAWLTFSDGVRSLNKTLLLTGGSDALVLAATELGNGSTQLRDGTITVSSGAGGCGRQPQPSSQRPLCAGLGGPDCAAYVATGQRRC